MMKIDVAELMGEDVLFGVAAGRICLQRLMERVIEPERPTVLYLDFASVASATVSFLREGPLAFRTWLRQRGSNAYPVFANMNAVVTDSLSEFLISTRDAVMACVLGEGKASAAQLVGQLDPKQKLTFEAVREHREVTATQLYEEHVDDEARSVTAWNNRLAALVAKGVVMEYRQGRRKHFSLTLGEVQ